MAKIGQPLALLALYLTNPKEILHHINTRGPQHVLEEDGYLKHCHLPIIDGDIKLARWLVVGWILGWRTPDTQKPRNKLAKAKQNTHMPTMAAAVVPRMPWYPPLRRRRIQQSANLLRDTSMS